MERMRSWYNNNISESRGYWILSQIFATFIVVGLKGWETAIALNIFIIFIIFATLEVWKEYK